MAHDRNDSEADEVISTSRRRLLGAATGSFALAASGLFLPPQMPEAEARNGSMGGALGGRRGSNSRGRQQRHQKRKHKKGNRKQDRRPDVDWSLIRYTAMRAEYIWEETGVSVDFYFRVKGSLDSWGPLVYASSGEFTHGNVDYAPERYSIAAYMHGPALPTSVFVEARNGLAITPWATVITGASIDGAGLVVGGKTILNEHGFDEPEDPWDEHGAFNAYLGKGIYDRDMNIKVRRLADSDTHKWFTALIL